MSKICQSDRKSLDHLLRCVRAGVKVDATYCHPTDDGWIVCWRLHPAISVWVLDETLAACRTVDEIEVLLDTQYAIEMVVRSA